MTIDVMLLQTIIQALLSATIAYTRRLYRVGVKWSAVECVEN